MANQLKMAMVHAILTLARLGWSLRRIAKELEVDREAVFWIPSLSCLWEGTLYGYHPGRP